MKFLRLISAALFGLGGMIADVDQASAVLLVDDLATAATPARSRGPRSPGERTAGSGAR